MDSPDRKFTIGQEASNTLNFTQLAGRLVDDLAEEGACIRLTGPSGIGKTRALHQALSTSTGSLQRLTESNFIFCDYRGRRQALGTGPPDRERRLGRGAGR